MLRERMQTWLTMTGASVLLLSAFALGATGVVAGRAFWDQAVILDSTDLVPPPVRTYDVITPVEQRINEREGYIRKLRNREAIARENVALASLYSELGRKSESLGRLPHAELALLKASTLYPSSPQFREDLANLYENASKRAESPEQRAVLLSQAAESWLTAESLATKDLRPRLRVAAVEARTGSAQAWISAGNSRRARDELSRAAALAPNDTQVRDLARLLR